LQKENLRIAQLQLKEGTATELDVDEGNIIYNNTLALSPEFQSQLAQAENAMSILLSEPPGAVRARLAKPAGLPKVPATVAIGVPADMLRRRPDIRVAEYEAAAQSAQIGVAKADLYPSFSISGAIGVKASNFADLFSPASVTHLISPGFTWDFLNYGRILNNVRVQDATFEELLLNYRNTVLSAYAEVENGLVAFLKAKQEGLYYAKSVNAARHAVELVVNQYKNGTADFDRVVDVQKDLLNAEKRKLAARADELTDIIAVYKGLAGGWIPPNVEGFAFDSSAERMRERTNWGGLL
jgi:outer membrane protein TolC